MFWSNVWIMFFDLGLTGSKSRIFCTHSTRIGKSKIQLRPEEPLLPVASNNLSKTSNIRTEMDLFVQTPTEKITSQPNQSHLGFVAGWRGWNSSLTFHQYYSPHVAIRSNWPVSSVVFCSIASRTSCFKYSYPTDAQSLSGWSYPLI